MVRNTNVEYSVYIGSSYGRKGLGNRVLKNHLNPTYRKRHSEKALCIAMAETEAITSFICLLSYAEPVPIGQVLLAEAVCACLFNTFDSDLYHDLRPQCLPRVDMSHGLNRSDPLRTLPVGPKSIGNDVTTFRRLRTLHNCLGKGPIRVSYYVYWERETKSSWRFQLFTAMFTIPKKIAAKWNLANNPKINVERQVSSGVHPHAFAAEAGEQEDGRCVGIRAFKIVRGKIEQHWIRRYGKDVVRVANTLHDFLKGYIVGQDYTWKASQKYIFSEKGGSKIDSPQNAPKRRDLVRLPYDGKDFQWDDGIRLPETKPRSCTRASIQTRMESEECTSSYEDWVAEMHQKYLAPYHAELSKFGHRTYHRNWAERCNTNKVHCWDVSGGHFLMSWKRKRLDLPT